MTVCKTIATLLVAKTLLPKLSDDRHEEHVHKMEEILCQEAVVLLMNAMVATRPDLAFAVNVVSQFMFKPGPMYWRVVKQIM